MMTNDETKTTTEAEESAAEQASTEQVATDQAAADSGARDKRTVEEKIASGEILSEVAVVGQRFGKAMQSAWDSEQRRVVQQRVVDELRTAGDHVENLTKKVSTNRSGQNLHDEAEKIGRHLGDGLLSGLKALNRELSRTIDKYEERRQPHDDDDGTTEP